LIKKFKIKSNESEMTASRAGLALLALAAVQPAVAEHSYHLANYIDTANC
jgi:hypothetical protein